MLTLDAEPVVVASYLQDRVENAEFQRSLPIFDYVLLLFHRRKILDDPHTKNIKLQHK